MPRLALPIHLILVAGLTSISGAFADPQPTPSPESAALEAAGCERLALEPNSRGSHWLVPVKINGKPCKLTLDTGADYVILESWAPAFLGLTMKPSDIQAQSVAGSTKLVTGEAPLVIGSSTIETQHIRAETGTNPSPPANEGQPPCGVLGMNALRELGVAIDFRNHSLWIPAKPPCRIAGIMKARKAAIIPLGHTKTGHLRIEGKAGEQPLRFVVDSGAENSVLSMKTAESMKLELAESNTIIRGANEANKHPKSATLNNVSLGNAHIPRFPIHVLPLENVFNLLSKGEPQPIVGIIGADLLVQGNAVLDVAADTLYLGGSAPAAPPASSPVPDGHVLVPCTRDGNDNYLLSADVNGHQVWMALDSGADTIAFHKPLAPDLGVTLQSDNGSATGPDGKTFTLATGLIDSIDLPGGMAVNKQRFPFTDLGAFSETTIDGKPARLGGLLGHAFMTPSQMILDCGEGRVLVPRKAKPGEYLHKLQEEGGRVVPLLTGETGRLYLPVEFGETRAALLIDTGAAVSALSAEHPVTAGLERETTGGRIRTLGKTVSTENAIMPGTMIGSVSLPNLRFVLLPDGRAGKPISVQGREVCGIIGNNHLSALQTVIDFGTKQAIIPVNRLGKKQP